MTATTTIPAATRATARRTMTVAQVPAPGAEFELTKREVPEPGPGEVLIRVQACGVCHSDAITKDGAFPGIAYPRVPGHEVVGVVDAVGVGVTGWEPGRRVGVGWHGGHDGTCRECRRGDFRNCRNLRIPGISYDGGYEEYMIAPLSALVAIPDSLGDVEAAPLLCAGLTMYNSLRHSGALPGDLVAVQGIGGLGHLGIQFASRCGYEVVAIGLGTESEALARQLGAHLYIDTLTTDAAEALQRRGGARTILATAPSGKAMGALVGGLAPNGRLVAIGVAFDPKEVTPVQLILGNRSIRGWTTGTPADNEDTLRVAELTGVRPLVETYPLERVAEAYERMRSAKARFRVVLTMPGGTGA